MVVFDFLRALVQRRLKFCSVMPKIIVRVTFNGKLLPLPQSLQQVSLFRKPLRSQRMT